MSAPSPRRLHACTSLLAVAAGAGDAFAFAQLGGVFTANLTGSLVLTGLTTRPGYGSLIAGAAITLVFFLAAVYAVSRFTRSPAGVWLRPVLAGVVALNFGVFLLGLAVLTSSSMLVGRLALLALSAAAMGAQTAAVRRYETHSGLTSTFVTGTLTSLAMDAADRKPTQWLTRGGVVLGLVSGALISSLVMTGVATSAGPLVACLAAAAAAAMAPGRA